jgi:Ca2+-binding RTX toxin-like protein
MDPPGPDVIHGEAGTDHIYGNDGNDTELSGGDALDYIYGGNGFDTIFGDASSNYLYGENDNDTIYGGTSNDIIYGGPGADHIHGGGGSDYIQVGTTTSTDSGERAECDEGNIYGGAGHDHLSCVDDDSDGVGCTIVARAGDDVLEGGDGDDVFNGGTGNDIIVGGDGQDTITGGDGNDCLMGGTWTTIYDYGKHNMFEFACSTMDSDDNDTIYGDGGPFPGTNAIYGCRGNDTLRGGGLNDRIWGGDQFAAGQVRDNVNAGDETTNDYCTNTDDGTYVECEQTLGNVQPSECANALDELE